MANAKKQVNEGLTLNMVATGEISHNEIVTLKSRIGVVTTAAEVGQMVAVHLEGVFIMPAETGTAFAVGQDLFWNDTNKVLTATTGPIKAGFCARDKAASDTEAWVKIN